MSNPMASYVSVGDRYGSYITIAKQRGCKSRINEMVDSNDIKFKETKCGVEVYEGYQPHLDYSTATKESEWLCSSDNKFIVQIRPKDSPIKDKYFEEFVC